MRALFSKTKEPKTPTSPSSPMTPSSSSSHLSNSNTPDKTLSPLGRKLSFTSSFHTPKRKDSNSTHMSPSALSTKESYHMAFCENTHSTPIRNINMDPATTTEKDSIFNKYDYDEDGNILDPLVLLMDKEDVFIASSTFGRQKGNDFEECILVFGKLNMYRIIKDATYKPKLSEMELEVDEEIQSRKGSLRKVAREEEFERLGAKDVTSLPPEDAKNPLFINDNVFIQTDITEPFEGVGYRSRWVVKWKIPWCMVNSIQKCETNDRQLEIILHVVGSATGFSKKEYICTSPADREVWYFTLSNVFQAYNKEYFETMIVHAPEVYQYHLFLQKGDDQKRAIVFSNKRLYNAKMAIGEADEKKIKLRYGVPIEHIKFIKRFSKTPNALCIVFDKKKASKDKSTKGSVSENYVFTTSDEITCLEMIKELAMVFHMITKTEITYEFVEGSATKGDTE
ncbi:predicted protein [Naegleria gruberi]|uniref:Predicted protein n=1 Tax=Naegleria gruberi TaxID=5762 RepID=D2V2Q4_NAEGR|nr:uncharacterized protein NAEGRDRAFT_63080 [Naegleria gruberi]EFC48936.1 predicted protein [Naegleria gruberi]|eukprot:XP_002681680.1 predicted protein [Naegleria gruberi strain NEG-M]